MRRFYHPHLPSIGQHIVLDEKGSHHLLRVVGISKNEEVEVFDGKGRACIAFLQDVKKEVAKSIICRGTIQRSSTHSSASSIFLSESMFHRVIKNSITALI